MNSNHQGTQHATEGAGGEEEDEGVQEEVAQIVLNSVCLFVFVQSTRKRHQFRAGEGWPHKHDTWQRIFVLSVSTGKHKMLFLAVKFAMSMLQWPSTFS